MTMGMPASPYKRLRALGEGAVGDVHLCVDMERRRLVVVKWLRAEVHAESEAALRFRREAELMAGRHMPGVIRVDEWNVDELGRTWMAMEFVDGLPPSAVIRAGDAWLLHRLLRGVGPALDALHGMGILHRDLKPDNMLVRAIPQHELTPAVLAGDPELALAPWVPVLIDLGIAKWLSEETATTTGSVFGTPHYMSPEQFRDAKHVGPATDRYAVAVIVYELLSGRLPFNGRNLPELLRQHVESPVPALSVPRPDPRRGDQRSPTVVGGGDSRVGTSATVATPNLDAFMRIAMAKAPMERYRSSTEMAEAFRAAAIADGVFAPPTRPAPLFDPLDRPFVEVTAEGKRRVFDLREGPVTFGRHERCPVPLSSPRLSRQHACLYLHRGKAWVADLGSQNGTSLFGRALNPGIPAAIATGDEPTTITLYDVPVQLRFAAVA
jgi:serine/threonine protein kinase